MEVPSVPTRNINLTPEIDEFVASKVDSGLYSNASEVMRAALRLLEQEEREQEERLQGLRAAIDKGIASGVADPGLFSRLRTKHGLLHKSA